VSEVELRTVTAGEAELRLDRWFRRHFPALSHGRLQKLLRTGQVRIDGRRAQANARLAAGQTVRVPPLAAPHASGEPARVDAKDAAFLRSLILAEDDALMVLDKPAGLAVQGGTKTSRHVDGMLASLAAGGERPRLVHRLDRDTSGILVVAKTADAAAKLTRAFRQHKVDKLYWALVVGRPALAAGIIDQPLAKQQGGAGRERVEPDEEGRAARTAYRTVARAGRIASWLAMKPLTGRTHQLRAHCVVLGTPIVGDRKYGDPAGLHGAPDGLMLHAREIRLPHPDGGELTVTAPISKVMQSGFAWLGFEPDPSLPGARLADFEQI
jgi:23S rRNA pseudouridine955/2504/2580 synthase